MTSSRERRERLILSALLALLFLFSLLRFDGPSRGYWDTYISVPAIFMTGQHVELQRIDGTPRFDYELSGRIPDDTFDPTPGSFGIASKDQRIGTCILMSAPFALFAMAAFRWIYALSWTLMAVFAFLSIRRLLAPPEGPERAGGFALPLVGSAVLVLNPFSLYLDRLNGNLFGLAILTFLFFLVQERRPPWWLIGLVYGLLGGIRNEAIVLAPLFVAFMWPGRAGNPAAPGAWPAAKSFVMFGVWALIGILPVLLWNRFAYGEMIIHPSQVAHLDGFRPTFPHTFLGREFQFNGLLNWPFHDRLVRTPHFAFPAFLHWALVTVKSLGLILTASALMGTVALLKRRPFEALGLLFWYAIVYALFFFQENWEELKQTFMALHMFPLAAFTAAGLQWLIARRASRLLMRRAALLLGLAALLGALVFSARHLEIPEDERWYERFPHAAANATGLLELPDERRKDWHFFHTRAAPAAVERERRHMTTPNPLPALYRPFTPPVRDNLTRIPREPFERELKTLAIWSYIYE